MLDLKTGNARPSPGPPAWRRSMAMPAGGMARIAGPLQRLLLACGAGALLSGCYTVDQRRFAASMHALLPEGVAASEAVRRLQANGFNCYGSSAVPTCAKTRQRLLPSTCIERVNLVVAPGTDVLESVEVQPIVCAGF
ncbi:MAG TPA: hypothetical protein VF774_28775 [Pseudoduganella sp.]